MRRSFGRQRPSKISELEAEALPIFADGEGNDEPLCTPKTGASKLACAFKALQCSSRAAKEEHELPMYPPSDGSFPSRDNSYSQQSPTNDEKQTFWSRYELDAELQSAEPCSRNVGQSPQHVNAVTSMASGSRDFDFSPFSEQYHGNIDSIFNFRASPPLETDEKDQGPGGRSPQGIDSSSVSNTPTLNPPKAQQDLLLDIKSSTEDPIIYEDEKKVEDELPEQFPNRIKSEDTHDTQPVSNVDPNKGPRQVTIPTNEEVKLDDFCKKYFNTPRVVHTAAASLGDSITPLNSPLADESDITNHHTSSTSMSPGHEETRNPVSVDAGQLDPKEYLKLPEMEPPAASTAAPITIDDVKPICEMKVEEPPALEDPRTLNLDPEQGSGNSGIPELSQANKSLEEVLQPKAPSLMRPSQGSFNTESSFSSVSSFTEVTAQPRKKVSNLSSYRVSGNGHTGVTPRPFFWRSHPVSTVTSYDRQPKLPLRNVGAKLTADIMQGTNDFSMSEHSNDKIRGSPASGKAERVKLGEGSASYLHPGVVRKLWLDGKPFGVQVNTDWQSSRRNGSNRHPQGPPSTRSRPFVQSLTSFAMIPTVFRQTDGSTKPADPLSSR